MRTAFLPPLQISKPRLFCLHHSPSLPTHTHFRMCISEHITRLRTLRPNLGPTSHKGQSGRIAIIGGSELYTGAPFFAAQSALYAGTDLSYVYTTSPAAPPIKSYSPDLIVHPGFHHLGEGLEALERMHAVVVGPGLGREEYAGELLGRVLGWGGNVVIDADALWFLRDEGWRGALGITGVRVLTPNKIEALRLLKAADCDTMESFTTQYSNVVVVEKGPVDRIICQGRVVEVSVQAARKRAGGQGDVLAGVIAAFCAWCDTREDVFSAAVCASMVARTAGRKAYAQVGRALVSSDLLRFVGSAVEEVFGADDG